MSQSGSHPPFHHPSFQTTIIHVDPQAPDATVLQPAADLLRNGQVVAFPTETVYGLGANGLDRDAVAKIFAAKGRPASNPLIVHIYSMEQLRQVAVQIPETVWRCAERFWPGPLTLVMPKSDLVPSAVTAGGETVAVRMPRHSVARLLLELTDRPIVAPSANLFTRPSPTTAQHVFADLYGRIPMIVDGGPTQIGVESTVLDLTTPHPTILRPGGLSREAIAELFPDVIYSPTYNPTEYPADPPRDINKPESPPSAAPSPGMMLKHYAPGVPIRLYDGPADESRARLWQAAKDALAQGNRVGLMIVQEDIVQEDIVQEDEADAGTLLTHPSLVVASLGSQVDPSQAAQRLFAAIRALEADNVDLILARTLAKEGLGLAVWDRLFRATEGRIIRL